MLRSRMLPDGFKLFFGICLFALGGVFIVGVGSVLRTAGGPTIKDNLDSNGIIATLTGPMTIGWSAMSTCGLPALLACPNVLSASFTVR